MKCSLKPGAAKLASLLLILSLLSVAAPVSAVDNSVLDRTRHAVGLLGFDVDGPGSSPPFFLCSGFVISDYAFATAAHCVAPFGAMGIPVSFVVTLQSGSPDDPVVPPGDFNAVPPYNFTDFPILVDTVVATTYYVHPNFDPATRVNDVAVIEFPAGTFSVKPVRLPKVGFLDWADHVGVLYQVPVGLVGYGGDEDLGSFVTIPGYRKRGFAIATDLTENTLISGTNEVMDSQNLPGDSGSPQFVLGRAVSLASHSHVVKQRLDTPPVQSFLAGFTN